MGYCDWCEKEGNLRAYRVEGSIVNLCDNCIKAHENERCIVCGASLYGELSIRGRCSDCQQLKAAKEDKARNEVIDGLGVLELSKLTKDIEFTEKDYEEWVTTSGGYFNPETRRRNRRRWIRNKLVNQYGWTNEMFIENLKDIEEILDNYFFKIANEKCKLVLAGTRGLKGVEIIVKKGNIIVIKE